MLKTISEKDALGLFNLPSPTSQICCLATVFPSPGEVDAEILIETRRGAMFKTFGGLRETSKKKMRETTGVTLHFLFLLVLVKKVLLNMSKMTTLICSGPSSCFEKKTSTGKPHVSPEAKHFDEQLQEDEIFLNRFAPRMEWIC